ncbi:MAG: AMP-binding protein, partial [Clostridiales bacterium]|nr:AMP-binding protein [Clostridiales bacterium]
RLRMTVKAPWLAHYADVPHHLNYHEGKMFDLVNEAQEHYPDNIAYSFLGNHTTYKSFIEQTHLVAKAFYSAGIREGQRVTICLPNVPQLIQCFYALNLIGAVANMIHPLSSEGEIAFYLKDSESVAAVTLDAFYGKFAAARKEYDLPKLIITSIGDALAPLKRFGYKLTEGRKIAPIPAQALIIRWADFLSLGQTYQGHYISNNQGQAEAVILYSGGTTGISKGISLSSYNFNALAQQTAAMGYVLKPEKSMLCVLPFFHGFGLGVCMHAMLFQACRCILIPRFNPATYADLLRKEQPNYIAGVPSLFEALLRNPDMDRVDLSCLLGVFSGGDSLSIELKKKVDIFLKKHHAGVEIREGYGMTESVTASCLTPYNTNREGSVGLPFPDTYYKIVAVGTQREVPYGEEGEICVIGPTLMKGYVNHPEETAKTLQTHADGQVWLHTGDLGLMDAEGFVYFRQRLKRMIITSGYSVYPSQLENVIDAHEAVLLSCIIGVPDPVKKQKIKAFVVLQPGVDDEAKALDSIWEHCRRHIAKYSLPYEIELRDDLPRTLVGKVAFKVLEAEEEMAREQKEGLGVAENLTPQQV